MMVLCDDGCLSTNLLLHPNEDICMTSAGRFPVFAYVWQLYCYFLFSAAGLRNPNKLSKRIYVWRTGFACSSLYEMLETMLRSISKLGLDICVG